MSPAKGEHRELVQIAPVTTPFDSVQRDEKDGSLIRWPVVAWGLVRDHRDDQAVPLDGRVHWYQNDTVALVVLVDCGGEWGQLGEAGGLIVPARFTDAEIESRYGGWLGATTA